MNDHPSYPWDPFSDQPRIMRDKKLKRKIYFRAAGYFIKSAFLLPLIPIIIIILTLRKQWMKTKNNRCIGLSVHIESTCEGKTIIPTSELKKMLDDLNVKQILIRVPLSAPDNFKQYIQHINALSSPNREIAINLIQDRSVLDDPHKLKQKLRTLLPQIQGNVEYIHVGNAYNRRKWAFYHIGEYLRFFNSIRAVTKEISPNTKLIGGSVIDFEIPPFLESLFHFNKAHFDGYHSHLYVDRRGAPENKQAGFDFLKKINFISTMHSCSWKSTGELWISEINWPLKNTDKFSPCKGSVLVDPQTQADYLTRAYLIAIASGKIRTCYWHQLVAPGYGLVDNRKKTPEKRPSYHAFKTLNTLFNNAEIIHFDNGNHQGIKGIYSITALLKKENKITTIQAYWSKNGKHTISISTTPSTKWINQDGSPITLTDQSTIEVSSTVIYKTSTKNNLN